MSNSQYPLNRFNKPSKQLLVEMINKFNGVRLDPDLLIFGLPAMVQPDGFTEVTVKFKESTGWSRESRPVRYHRVEANRTPELRNMVIHLETFTDPQLVVKALFDQCGLLLEPELIEIQEIYGGLEADQSDINLRITNTHLTGFDETVGEPWVPDPDLDRNFRITFSSDHLIFFGTINVLVRPSIKLLGVNISRQMDLRQYYQDGNTNRPPVDLYQPKGTLLVSGLSSHLLEDKKTEAYLYEQKAGAIIEPASQMAELLSYLTGDTWQYTPEATLDFNIYNSTIIYNGLVSSEYTADDPRYSYVMVIELGALCRNLSGLLRIGYRYSSPEVPTNHQYNPASVKPIFQF